MSAPPAVAKQAKPTVTPQQITAAIDTFRKMFPDNPTLANTPDAEIHSRVQDFLASRTVFTPTMASPALMAAPAVGDYTTTCPYAIGVVIVDCIFMFLGFAGLRTTNSERIAQAAAREVGEEVAKNLPKWLKLIQNLKNAESMTDKASAIFKIGSAAYSAGMFRGILASIESSMTWWDWTITGVAAVAQIAALVLTDGAAFIAEVALNATSVAYVVSDSVKAVQCCG